MKRISQLSMLIILFVLLYFLLPFSKEPPARESMIFFPLDPNVTFTKAHTRLVLEPKKKNNEYVLRWHTTSSLDRKVYLRQDISLIFADGRLLGTLSKWKENSQTLLQEKTVTEKNSRLFQAISFHYGEIHDGEDIRSSQKMSGDYLYVIDSAYSPLMSFRQAKTTEQKKWENVLKQTTRQFLDYKTKQLANHFSIREKNYYYLYLPELMVYNEQPFPDLSMEKTQKIIGSLWEGLYKNYFLGIKKKNGTIVSPIGSTMPVIFISKDYTYLIVLFETRDGEQIQLIQQIS
ncbi:hypothetical protein B0I26_102381 [Anoxybacillus vitaminiphilus]|uniref:Uncharacterized protein n=1 Tax=Paranoxybacillus vitaminiphilus TaxID=581036 RepID=A0A327YQC9_9BACL|nr:hypothetical protein [Anoxybacillus vitaminiphilus]RAK22387.1 hypothetical protein B0I26_102381 [Anoxybacillus vitaminiphilus]